MTDFTPEYARHESIQSRLFIVQAAAEVRNKLKAGELLFIHLNWASREIMSRKSIPWKSSEMPYITAFSIRFERA
jgi:hypothetical protein